MTELLGERVALRPLREDDVPALRAMRDAPTVRQWWGSVEDDFPFGDDPAATRFAIVDEGELAGLIQYGEENEPDYRHAWIDLFISPDRQGEGLGQEAIATLMEHLTNERGHHRITIDPAADNTAAIRCYEKAGFRRVGVLEAQWRDPSGKWRDAVLMERVVRR